MDSLLVDLLPSAIALAATPGAIAACILQGNIGVLIAFGLIFTIQGWMGQ